MNHFLEPLEDKGAPLFLVAGGLLVVFAALLGVEAATGGAMPEDLFGPPGYAVAAVGLVALYPALARRSTWLARIGASAAALAAVGWLVLTVLSALELSGGFGATAPEETAFGAVALGFTGLGMILGYPLMAVAALRSEQHGRKLGLLLLAPPVIFVTVFAVLAPSGVSEAWGPFIAAVAQAAAHLAIAGAAREHVGTPDAPTSAREPAHEHENVSTRT